MAGAFDDGRQDPGAFRWADYVNPYQTPPQQLSDLANPLRWPAMAVEGIQTAVETMPRMLQPGYDYSNTRQAAEDAFNVAGVVGAGSLLGTAAKPANAVGIFGGRLAKTADQAALAKAEQMASQGVPREQIWNDTGWFQGVDGKWRFEIDDSDAALSDNAVGAVLNAGKYAGKDLQTNYWGAFKHKNLEDAYGADITELRDFNVRHGKPAGSHDRQTGAISVSATDPSEARSIALHELQHAGQELEQFAPGGSPDMSLVYDIAAPSLREIRAQKAALGIDPYALQNKKQMGWKLTQEEQDALRKYDELTAAEDAVFAGQYEPFEAYRRLAGEVEARAVQKRRDMTAEERRARAPWLDYDVPEDQQIVRSLLASRGAPVPVSQPIQDPDREIY